MQEWQLMPMIYNIPLSERGSLRDSNRYVSSDKLTSSVRYQFIPKSLFFSIKRTIIIFLSSRKFSISRLFLSDGILTNH